MTPRPCGIMWHLPGTVITALPRKTNQKSTDLSTTVLQWWDEYGRKDLPWQQDISPYRVWVSEIMLQQTQVSTVIGYFERFVSTFPTIADLASAPEDQVLHLWTGLGYYARARNLHQAAKAMVDNTGGAMPDSLEDLVDLPGIGLSTAGAIRSIAFGKPAAILDGNVKRVLARYHGIEGWPGTGSVLKALWEVAEEHTPASRCGNYSQAMMDLGATVCVRGSPSCEECPLALDCVARAQGSFDRIPGRKPRKTMPVKTVHMLMMQRGDGQILLEKRPPTGIWGGLWSFPELSTADDLQTHVADRYQLETDCEVWAPYRHTFSHYHLDISPVHIALTPTQSQALNNRIMETDQQLWYNIAQPQKVGLAAPVVSLLGKLPVHR